MFNINVNVIGQFRLRINVGVYVHADDVACMPHAPCSVSFVVCVYLLLSLFIF